MMKRRFFSKSPKRIFLNPGRTLFLAFCLLLAGLVFDGLAGEWQKAAVYPGSKKILQVTAEFPECWERNIYNYNEWLNYNNKKNKITGEQVLKRVRKVREFTLNSPGHLTFAFVSDVPKEVFYHQEPTFWLLHLGDDNAWHKVATATSTYYKCSQGGKTKSESGLLSYQVKPDGSLLYLLPPPLYQPGRYQVVIEAGKRTGANDLAYVQGNAKLAIYVIQTDNQTQKGDMPGQISGIVTDDQKISAINGLPGSSEVGDFRGWHVDERIKAGLKKVVEYMRRRSHELKLSNPSMSGILNDYADKLIRADIYSQKNSFINKNGKAQAGWFGAITIFSNMYDQDAVFVSNYPTDSDLGNVASLLMHEIKHTEGGDEWDAHDLQRKTFDALKVSHNSSVRVSVDKFFKVFSKPSVFVRFYWLLID